MRRKRGLFDVNIRDRKVLVIYTGGTMGMKPNSQNNLAVCKGYLTEQIKKLPEADHEDMPRYDIIEYEQLIDSSCMTAEYWNSIALDIEKHYEKYDGFVIIMGTDTMAYTSSAVSFMLENLRKPVVFTGSQIPFFRVNNDARRNLINSMIVAATLQIPEVCLCFNDKLMRANRSMKVNSTGLDAFDSPNCPPLAMMGCSMKIREEMFLKVREDKPFRAFTNIQAMVIVLKIAPVFDVESILMLVRHSHFLRAIVLELYGTGNGPSNNVHLLETLSEARNRNIVVVALSQCVRGGVEQDTYVHGQAFADAGVVSGGDMTTEACTAKLAYLCGKYSNPDKVREYIGKNIRGELTTDEEKPSWNELAIVPDDSN